MRKEEEYAEFVDSICKRGVDIKEELTPQQAHALHMAVGVSGEAGELLDAIKKWTIYQKRLDLENVIEELGDLEFYMQGVRNCLGLQREDIIAHNTEKLGIRYENGYSNKAAIIRKDKA